MTQAKLTVYRVSLTGVWEGEATNNQDAMDKTIAYFAAHLDELNYQITTRDIFIDVPEE
jgi:hypothetical protein